MGFAPEMCNRDVYEDERTENARVFQEQQKERWQDWTWLQDFFFRPTLGKAK